MNQTARPKGLLPAIGIGICALAVGIWAGLQLDTPVATPAASFNAVTVLPTPRALPELELMNQNAATVGREAFEGRWSLVFMGFTNCGHVCPMAMAEIRMIHDQVTEPVNVVFFSVDPQRDTPGKLKAYVESFDKSFKGMTGTPDQIETFANTLGAPYFVDTNPDNYIVDHSSAVFVIDPSASLAGVISQPFEIDMIVTELNALL